MNNINFLKKIGIFFTLMLLTFSCNRDQLDIIETIHVKVTSGLTEQPIDLPFVLKIEGDNGQDITSQSQIKVNGVLINGNSFTPNSEGIFSVQAFFENFISAPKIVRATTPSDYSQKVLVEDYTGTWCGWCPRVSYAIQQAKLQSNKVVSVAIHITDIYTFDGCVTLKNEFGVSGLPIGKINRINTWTINAEPQNLNEVINRTGFNAPLGLAIDSEISNGVITASIRVGFANTYTENLNLVVYLVENGLIKNQTNYTEYYGGASTLVNFVHNDVLRAIYTHHLGNPIPAFETVNDHIYTYNLQQNIPASISNTSNLTLVAFVVKAATKEVVNVQEVHVGNEVGFE